MNSISNNINMLQADKLASLQAAKQADAAALNAQSPALDASDKDAKTAAKQIETVFLNELLRIMMEQTSFGQDKTVSTYLPAITSEMSKSLAERGGIGLGQFILKGNGLTRYGVSHQASGVDTGNDKSTKKKVNIFENPPI